MEDFFEEISKNGISPEEEKRLRERTEKSMAIVDKIWAAQEQLKEEMGEFYAELTQEEAIKLINQRVAENDEKLKEEIDKLTAI